jgi:6-phosphogluconolactonase
MPSSAIRPRITILGPLVLGLLALGLFSAGCGGSSNSTPCNGCGAPVASSFLYAFSGDLTAGQILTFPIDPTTGALGTPTSTPGPPQPIAAAVVVGAQFLYVSEVLPIQVDGYSINPTTGVPTPVSGSPFAGVSTFGLGNGISSTDNFLYSGARAATSGGIVPAVEAFSISTTGGLSSTVTGSLFVAGLGSSSFAGGGPTLALGSTFLYVADQQGGNNGQPGSTAAIAGFSVNASTGVLTPVPGSPFSTGPNGSPERIVYDSKLGPYVYVALSNENAPGFVAGFSVDQASGALTPIPGSPFAAGNFTATLALDESGQFLFVSNLDNISVLRVGSGGVLAPISGSPFSVAGAGALFVFGNSLYVPSPPNSISGYNINETTGVLTPIPGSPFAAGPNAEPIAAVTLSSH